MVDFDRIRPLTFLTLLLTVSLSIHADDNPFGSQVRPTDPLSPSEQQRTFQLPPGFEIQLVAAEPDIQKPLNMAFDHRGRLWITDSVEYPYAAPRDHRPRDTIKVLEDTDGDGRADKIITFADGLNIPIGIYPCRDGAIAYSIPHIWKFQDTDRDGRSDKQTKLYGPMGYERDTHGLNNAFRRRFDGWLYACHGFNNQTTVRGTDGHTITMHSGNTYRMRLDGSRIEQFTWGQVNPFGMTMDESGNLFTSDCHSKPVYQLIRDGYYPSFGKPHDGLGFVPPMMSHTHGSTALAGVCYYSGENFPRQYRGNLFVGNVMTSRVNRNSLVQQGATILAEEQPDFVTSSDPWFRPVDIQIGPDGAMYIADFYNRIIGHYEVPLDHPGRDRRRGRIWRIVYTGDEADTRPARMPASLEHMAAKDVAAALEDANLTRRTIAMHLLVDKFGKEAVPVVGDLLKTSTSDRTRGQAAWILHRLDALDPASLNWEALSSALRVQLMMILAEEPQWSPHCRDLVQHGLTSDDPLVQRAAAEAFGTHPDESHALLLARFLQETPALTHDELLQHVTRIALRNQLADPPVFAAIRSSRLARKFDDQFADVAVAVNSHHAGEFLLDYLSRHAVADQTVASQMVTHAAQYAGPQATDRLVAIIESRFMDDIDLQRTLFQAVVRGFEQRGAQVDEHLEAWGKRLARGLFARVDPIANWTCLPLAGKPRQDNPWVLQKRLSADGDRGSWFLTTLPSGEQSTGILISPTFEIPASLQFFVAGHIGHPNEPVVARNFVRLKDATSDKTLAQARPPRNDIAQLVRWDLKQHAGGRGYIEITDGDERTAYAWLAVGRFSPEVIPLPEQSPRIGAENLIAAASMARMLKLNDFLPQLRERLLDKGVDPAARQAMAEALLASEPNGLLAALTPLISDGAVATTLRERICRQIVKRDPPATEQVLADAMKTVPARLQSAVAQDLASDRSGARLLVDFVSQGHASPHLLLDSSVRQRLDVLSVPALAVKVAELTANVNSDDEQARDSIATRAAQYGLRNTSLERGSESFTKRCAACHQLQGKGAVVGPQLDGIGSRGLERLLEDILDPNRNVDVAFHSTTIVTTEGKVVTGLLRREDGQSLVLADNKGQHFTVAKRQVDRQIKARTSLMPDNFNETIPDQEFYDLVAFLLSTRVP